MWSLRKSVEREAVVLRLSGRIEGEQLVELKETFASETGASSLILDLEGVKLVDQEVVTFLACCRADGIQLRNCPAYIQEWIGREKGTQGRTQ